MTTDIAEVVRMAQNLARNCGFAVFPCGGDKRPTLKRWPELASTDPDAIARLWRDHPGSLIGVVTGITSGVDVLDIDVKHADALGWYHTHRDLLPPTRMFRTRSGGCHLYFQHAEGVRNTQGKIVTGIDTRGDGGFVIYWFATGTPCLCHERPAPWPQWLLDELLAKPVPPAMPVRRRAGDGAETAIDGVLRLISSATEGERNGVLHWGACRLGERAQAGQIGRGEAEALLVAAGIAAGLSEHEARMTARSGLRRATA